MKKYFHHSKIMVSVFKEFGISLIGPKKSRIFYSEIDVDRFYVEGVLFELETRLGIVLDERESKDLQSPLDIILCFKNKLENLNAAGKRLDLRHSELDYSHFQVSV